MGDTESDSHTNPDADLPKRRQRPEASPSQRALGLLVRREHSRKELARKLTLRGVTAENAAAAVQRMATEGWQDDSRFALSLVRTRAAHGYGPVRIRAELGTHGIDQEAIAAAFQVLEEAGEGEWGAIARDLVQRRYGRAIVDDLATRRKAADFLIRRGFDGDTVRDAMRFDLGRE